MSIEKEILDLRKQVEVMQIRFNKNKELFLEGYETLALLIQWYHTNLEELSQNLGVEVSVELNKIITKAKMIASRAVVI